MKVLKLSDQQYEMVISGIAAEITYIKKLLKKKINETLKIHLQNRLTKLENFLQYVKEQ